LVALIVFLTPWNVRSEESKWFTTIYYGFYNTATYGKTLEFTGEVNSNRYVGLALGRELIKWKYASLEAEGLFAEHFGGMGNYEEYVVALGLRYHYFPWDEYVKTTVAVKDGPSYTTKQIGDENSYLLNFMGLELTLAFPRYDRLGLVLGINHRSGGNGTIGKGDTNFYVLGVRFKF
jgi:hypothetical protein